MSVWSGVLDSCPGLLCCVVNLKGKLIYATQGYKAVASKLFGHNCEVGGTYPPLITEIDRALHEALTAACLGERNAFEVAGRERSWEISASPLRIEARKISGVVIRIVPVESLSSGSGNPEILEAVPFRAGVVDSHGEFLAVNKFLAASVRSELTGKNVAELVKPENNSELVHAILKRSGSVECLMYDITSNGNFCDAAAEAYLDKELNDDPKIEKDNLRNIIIHASPITWTDRDCTLLTFEDVTDYKRTHDQLRRLLTIDNQTGILNRKGIEHAILREMGRTIKNSERLSLIMINIDKFTGFNKAKGYMSGTRTLRSFVNNMKGILSSRVKNTVSRWQGDELLVLVHCSGAAAVVIADEIRSKSDGIELSAGVADLTEGGYVSVSEFIGAAYDAMLEAKASGGNKTILTGKS